MNNKQGTSTQQELMPIFVDSYEEDKYILGCYANLSLLSFVVLKVNTIKNSFLIVNQGILKANNLKECSKEIMILFDKYKIRNVISNDVAEIINSAGYISEYKIDVEERVAFINKFPYRSVNSFIRWKAIEIANPEKSMKLILSLFIEKKLKFLDDNTMEQWKQEFDTFNIKDCLEGLKDYPLISALWYAMQFNIRPYPYVATSSSYGSR